MIVFNRKDVILWNTRLEDSDVDELGIGPWSHWLLNSVGRCRLPDWGPLDYYSKLLETWSNIDHNLPKRVHLLSFLKSWVSKSNYVFYISRIYISNHIVYA